MVVLAARLPRGVLKDLKGSCRRVKIRVRTLRADPRVPRRAKVVIALAGLWVISPIDLIPDFLPIMGPLDDVVVVALALPLRSPTDPAGGPVRSLAGRT